MIARHHGGILQRFREYLPVTDRTPLLSLHEGDTPLVHAPRLAAWVGVRELHLKYEGLNPTGSFKDRGMVLAVARAVEDGARAVLCASTGNTAASAAAYAAHAGIRSVVLLPAGRVAAGKLAQAVVYGAQVVTVEGSFDDALTLARTAADRYDLALVNSVNPARIEGQTTSAYEICDALGDAPALLALPVGNGGNITAYWLGFRRALEHGAREAAPGHARRAGGGRCTVRARCSRYATGDDRDGHPHRQPCHMGACAERSSRFGRRVPRGER
jgi:threonine synthase